MKRNKHLESNFSSQEGIHDLKFLWISEEKRMYYFLEIGYEVVFEK